VRNQRRSPHQHCTKNHLVIKFQRYDLPKSYQINVNGYGKYTINVETNIARVKINRANLSSIPDKSLKYGSAFPASSAN